MFIDTNPIPVKKAVELVGLVGGPVRLPLDELDVKKTDHLKKIIATIPAKTVPKPKVPVKGSVKKAVKSASSRPPRAVRIPKTR
jgi:4-hydroxy-tetrahydrodipicolinate synthase